MGCKGSERAFGARRRRSRDYPSLGDFLTFQFTIDLNYSEPIAFSEMEFVVAGPGRATASASPSVRPLG